MRPAILVLVMSSAFAQAQSPPGDPSGLDAKTEAARATEAEVAAKKAAELYRVTTEGSATALQLEPMSLLRWSNPVLGSFHGSVFVWSEMGRPAVVASIFKNYNIVPHRLGIEFHSLTEGRATAERDGHKDWSPVRGGAEFRPVPGASAPADTPARRFRQLRAMASEFSATKTGRNAVTSPLRLLTQPVYRYEANDPGGALFAFVEGTDPEVFLLIEARARDAGSAWHYTLARMNSVEFHVTHRGREVWSVPIIPWSKARDPREPYTLVSFLQREGGNLQIVPTK